MSKKRNNQQHLEDDVQDMIRHQKINRKEKRKSNRHQEKNFLKSMDYSNLEDEHWEEFEQRYQ